MQSESSIALCSLCRRPVTPDEGLSLSARLCDQCKSMIDAIKPAESKATAPQPVTAIAHEPGGLLEEAKRPLTTLPTGQPQLVADGPIASGFDWADTNHVPILVAGQSSDSRWRVWFLAALLALAAGGAVVYSQIDRIQGLLAGEDRATGTGVRASAPTFNPSVAAPPPSVQVDSSAARPSSKVEPTTSPPAAQVSSSPQPGSTQSGRALFSLQAASFPNGASAQQFSERLVRAGVPAYVIAADIPRRGKWYRVRAGKFATQEEARRYAIEWQQRARAGGVGIQLVACAFEQP